jgi:hypothetical protein
VTQRLGVVLAFAVTGLAGFGVSRLVAAKAEKTPVLLWHTITLQANADPKARADMIQFLEGKFFPTLVKQKLPGLIRLTVLRGTTARVDTITNAPAYQPPASYAVVEVWNDAESARQFRENPPPAIKALNDELNARDHSVWEHRYSMYDEGWSTTTLAAE